MATTAKQERQNLIDGLSEFLPDDMDIGEDEKVLILTNALGASIVQLKKEAGILYIQQKTASLNNNTDHANKIVEALVKVKKDLRRLNKDYKVLGGDQLSGEA